MRAAFRESRARGMITMVGNPLGMGEILLERVLVTDMAEGLLERHFVKGGGLLALLRMMAANVFLKIAGAPIESANTLAAEHESRGEYEAALELYAASLAARIMVSGLGGPDVATSCSNVARMYHSLAVVRGEQGECEEALELSRKCLDIRVKVLGAGGGDVSDACTAVSRRSSDLAILYQDQGRYGDALEV